MQNLLPMRLVFVGASRPVFDGETVTGLINVFESKLADVFNDSPGLLTLLQVVSNLSVAASTGNGSWLVADTSLCSTDTSEGR